MIRQLLGSHIDLSITVCREPWAVSVDPVKFEQVLTNLAVNAHDAMLRGGRFTLDITNVTVRAGDAGAIRHAPPGDYTRLDAEDTGTGMSPDVLQHIFEPFYTTKSPGRGTGLGLATCYGIIRQAEGLMWATSTVGRGSTFTILLPRVHETPGVWPPQTALEHARHGSERVLVVDDEPAVLGVVSRTLQRLGYRIASAGQGEEALALLERDTDFDLVLSDVVMPRMDGRALRRAGRARFPRVPVLLMTGYDTEAQRDDGPVLKKPFTAAELATAVRNALDGAEETSVVS
jgi:CheY-like chemotaxis protein